MSDHDFMSETIAISSQSDPVTGDQPFGSLVVRDGQIVGRGRNTVGTDKDPSAHAEMVAIRDACRRLGTLRLEGCVIYASCEPCPMCRAVIEAAGIARIVHAASAEDARELGFGVERKAPAVERMMADEARAALVDYRAREQG